MARDLNSPAEYTRVPNPALYVPSRTPLSLPSYSDVVEKAESNTPQSGAH